MFLTFISGVARGHACHAEHDLNFFKPKVFQFFCIKYFGTQCFTQKQLTLRKFRAFERLLACRQVVLYLPNRGLEHDFFWEIMPECHAHGSRA